MPSQGAVVSSCEVASDHEDSAISVSRFHHATEDTDAVRFDRTFNEVETDWNCESLTRRAHSVAFPPEHEKRFAGKCILRDCSNLCIAGMDCCSAHVSLVGIWCHHEACMTLPVKGSVFCSTHYKAAYNEPHSVEQPTLHHKRDYDSRPMLSNSRRRGKEHAERLGSLSMLGGSPRCNVRKPSGLEQQRALYADNVKPKRSTVRGGGAHCLVNGCLKKGQAGTQLCKAHGGGIRCQYPECLTAALWGGGPSKQFCAHHGGGKHCEHEGCEKFAQGRKSQFCVRHGGGDPCQSEGCPRKARGRTKFCRGHGGGSSCRWEGCSTSAIHRNSGFCQAHGPKSCRPCKHPGCTARAKGTGSHLCGDHGGGMRCEHGGGNCLRFVCLASMRRGGHLCKMHDKQLQE